MSVCRFFQGPVGPPYHQPFRGSTRPPGQSLASLKRNLNHEAWEAVAFPNKAAARVRFVSFVPRMV